MPTDPDEQFLRILRGILKADPSISQDPEKIVRVAAAVLRESRAHLNPSARRGTLPDVETPANVTRGAAISAGRTKDPTRLQQLIQERGLSLPEWLDSLPARSRPSASMAKSWTKAKGKGGRAIPRAWAKFLAQHFQAPELLEDASWPCGIR